MVLTVGGSGGSLVTCVVVPNVGVLLALVAAVGTVVVMAGRGPSLARKCSQHSPASPSIRAFPRLSCAVELWLRTSPGTQPTYLSISGLSGRMELEATSRLKTEARNLEAAAASCEPEPTQKPFKRPAPLALFLWLRLSGLLPERPLLRP